MAKVVSFIEVTVRCVVTDTPPNEGLNYDSGRLNYMVVDATDNDLTKGANNVAVDSIVGADTVDAWFGKVVQQVKDAESIT